MIVHFPGDQIEKNEATERGACMGEKLGACNVLMGTRGGKRQIGRLRSYKGVNIKVGGRVA